METYHYALIIAIILMFWTLYDERSSGFINNDSYFMTGEEQHTYPVLIHKVNIPPEW
jgi:hypothetical protein